MNKIKDESNFEGDWIYHGNYKAIYDKKIKCFYIATLDDKPTSFERDSFAAMLWMVEQERRDKWQNRKLWLIKQIKKIRSTIFKTSN